MAAIEWRKYLLVTRGNVIATQVLGHCYCERKKIIYQYPESTVTGLYPVATGNTKSSIGAIIFFQTIIEMEATTGRYFYLPRWNNL